MTTRIFAATLLLAAGALAADQDFNGRWDITTTGQPRPRAMWLELTAAGSPNPAGKFVSDHGGHMNKIDHIAIANGELRFSFDRPGRGGQSAPSPEYRARIVNGRLEGSVGGANFTGVRAPVIADKDDGSWKPGKPIELFNGKDLSGWKPLNPDAEMKWSVVGGILRNAPPTTDIISERKFWNFLLHVDFRIVEHSNSGIGLRGRYEIQILEDFGKPPNTHGAAALYARVLPSVNASKTGGRVAELRHTAGWAHVDGNAQRVKVLDSGGRSLTAIANADESEPVSAGHSSGISSVLNLLSEAGRLS